MKNVLTFLGWTVLFIGIAVMSFGFGFIEGAVYVTKHPTQKVSP